MWLGGGWLSGWEVKGVEKWLSVSQLSDETEIPETTLRRYIRNFSEYLRFEKIGRGMKYHPDSIVILKRIYSLYNDNYETLEIKKMLDMDFPINVEDSEDKKYSNSLLAVSLEKEFEEFKQEQQEFNKRLLEQLQRQQDYIEKLIEVRDEKLMETLNEIRETKKLEVESRKKWWKFWK